MLPFADFEARFFAALGALASLLLHAALLLVFLSGPEDVPPQSELSVEIVQRERAPLASPLLPARESDGAGSPEAPSLVVDDAVAAPSEAVPALPVEPPRAAEGFRERLRQREALFQADMELRRRRQAALELHSIQRYGQRFGLGGQPVSADGSQPQSGNEVRACGARDVGEVVPVTAARPMSRYVDVVPVGLFPPRYLDDVLQVARAQGGELGRVEMALPPHEVIIQLDFPTGAIFAVGRQDARCLVGFSWSREVFPLRFRGLPARYVDADDVVREVLMDVVLRADATFDVTVHDGDELPFMTGTLYDQDAVARNLQQRAAGARLVRDFLGALLGG